MEARQGLDISKPAVAFSQSSIEVNGFPIRYCEAGQGDALICLQDDGHRPSKAHELIAQRHRLIVFETPGSDRSSARATSPKGLADAMHTAVAGIGIDRFSIMADSHSAELALRMAIAHPQRVDAFVLLAPAMPDVSEKDRNDEFEARLPSLETPVLTLIGTNDPIVSSASARRYREKLRDFHLVMVYGAGAAMDAERPEAVAAVVEDFLARGGSFIVRNRSGIIYP
jgi:pimeloyl-ACP methyl ester carboxylesterase